MAIATNPNLAAIDAEYVAVRDAYLAARAVYQEVAERRQRAHRLEELKRSQQLRQLSGLSDEEWDMLRQEIRDPAPFAADIQVHEQGSGAPHA